MALGTALKLGWQRPIEIAAELATKPEIVSDLFWRVLEGHPEWSQLLLFIDQFEELFTVVNERHRTLFSELLWHVAQTQRLRLVVTLRADFYHRCLELENLAKLFQEGSFALAMPGLGALYAMITRPAARAELEFDENLPEQILVDTGKPGCATVDGLHLR